MGPISKTHIHRPPKQRAVDMGLGRAHPHVRAILTCEQYSRANTPVPILPCQYSRANTPVPIFTCEQQGAARVKRILSFTRGHAAAAQVVHLQPRPRQGRRRQGRRQGRQGGQAREQRRHQAAFHGRRVAAGPVPSGCGCAAAAAVRWRRRRRRALLSDRRRPRLPRRPAPMAAQSARARNLRTQTHAQSNTRTHARTHTRRHTHTRLFP